jgi:hypothetical protein
MKTQQFHGVTSFILMMIAMLIALVVMFMTSWLLGLIYLAVMALAPQVILRAYCAKCPCQARCAHIFPGKAAMAFSRTPGPYTLLETGSMMIAMLLLLGLPQYWLWQYPALFITFWGLSGVAIVQIRAFVCKTCNNIYCPVRVRTQN